MLAKRKPSDELAGPKDPKCTKVDGLDVKTTNADANANEGAKASNANADAIGAKFLADARKAALDLHMKLELSNNKELYDAVENLPHLDKCPKCADKAIPEGIRGPGPWYLLRCCKARHFWWPCSPETFTDEEAKIRFPHGCSTQRHREHNMTHYLGEAVCLSLERTKHVKAAEAMTTGIHTLSEVLATYQRALAAGELTLSNTAHSVVTNGPNIV
jgi:hypothetical protein